MNNTMLNLSNIQHFSLGDGDGIRTTVFLKGCNLRCPWCHNPENLAEQPAVLHYKTTGKTETRGRLVSAAEILPELLWDIDYYKESGGGITVSGGEPLLQADGVAELSKLLSENGVPVLIDTAGCVPYSAFQKVNPFVSGYLFDFKTANETKYRQIGGTLSLVCENIAALMRNGVYVTIRIPLIPDFNTDSESVRAICERLTGLGVTHVELLPFHRLGSGKYEAMGRSYPYENKEPLREEELCAIEETYKKHFSVRTEK